MHRWRLPLPKRAVVSILLLLVPLAVVFGAYWVRSDVPISDGANRAAVELADISQVVLASGVAQPRLKVDVSAQVSGQVLKLHVQPGDAVNEGQLLVSLNPDLARNDVAQARASLAQQSAALASKKIDLSLAEREAQRQKILFKGQATSATELEKAEADLAKIQRDLAGLVATQNKQEVDVANAVLKLNFTQVSAPMAGEVASVAVQKGQTVNANYQSPVLLTLAKLDVMTIRAQVSEADIRRVRVGQQATFSTLGDSEKLHTGNIRLIQPLPEKLNNAVFYNVLFDVPNTGETSADRPLMSEMTGQVKIVVAQVQQVLTLPLAALGEKVADDTYLVQVSDVSSERQHTPQKRRIRIGLSDNTQVQVVDGLQLGEQVLLPRSVQGVDTLSAPKLTLPVVTSQ